MTAPGDLWVFGYGSLMWRPGFAYAERLRARLDGYHRCFCISSTHHRGTPQRPGLVLGLDRGGGCDGIVYRVPADAASKVHHDLRVRELVNGVYREAFVPIHLHDGRTVDALAYIVERAHPSYAGELSLSRQAFLIRGARGVSGDNLDYLINTVRHLGDTGIRDRGLERLVALAGPHVAQMGRRSDALVNPSAKAIRCAVSSHPARVRLLPKGERRRFLYRMRVGQDA